jgi:site-specific DNA-cytosine methylase
VKHASIIPLIGGEAIGTEQAFGTPPDYLLSYSPFVPNDSHLVNYYEHRGLDVPYHLLDTGGSPGFKLQIDSMSSVCPCAGLSQLNVNASSESDKNDWMVTTAEYVLEVVKPTVYWGENAPGLVGNIGAPVRDRLFAVAKKHGYSVSFYKTKSQLHGLPQVRKRSFYFFWRGDRVPLLPWFERAYPKIEDLIRSVKSNFQQEPINPKIPSKDDPYYRYVLEVLHGGMSHREFAANMPDLPVRSIDAQSIIELAGHTYAQVSEWFQANGYEKQAKRCLEIHEKLAQGGQIMRRTTIVPKEYIGAFVGHYPTMLTHPDEDRYITFREGMTIMGLPDDFELLNPKRQYNHMCQNVPVQTAADVASGVYKALTTPEDVEWVSADAVYQDNMSKTTNQVKNASLSNFF